MTFPEPFGVFSYWKLYVLPSGSTIELTKYVAVGPYSPIPLHRMLFDRKLRVIYRNRLRVSKGVMVRKSLGAWGTTRHGEYRISGGVGEVPVSISRDLVPIGILNRARTGR